MALLSLRRWILGVRGFVSWPECLSGTSLSSDPFLVSGSTIGWIMVSRILTSLPFGRICYRHRRVGPCDGSDLSTVGAY